MVKANDFTQKDFTKVMTGLGITPADGPFAVAVSGGPDSMALSLLFSGWGEASYLTFDHGLREGSQKEAEQVGRWLKQRGLSHKILTWHGEKPATGIQAAARTARYRALEGWCRDHGIKALVLAHTRDDQAETFLMRLIRGSGVDGLAAMAPVAPPLSGPDSPRLVRPLLGVSKQALKEYLTSAGQPWVEDPSNQNLDFMRVKVRKLLGDTEIEGFTAETLAKTAARMARVKEVLGGRTQGVLEKALVVSRFGFGELDVAEFHKAHEEIALRALSRMLIFFGGGGYPTRLEQVERLCHALGQKEFKGATLAGCLLEPKPKSKGVITFSREVAAISDVLTLKPGERGLWDRRFELYLDKKGAAGEVRALGQNGWWELRLENPDLKALNIPLNAILGFPALYRGGKLSEVPHLKIPEKGRTLSVQVKDYFDFARFRP